MESELNMAMLPTPTNPAPVVQNRTPEVETSPVELNVTNKCYMFDYGKQMSRLMSFTDEENRIRKQQLLDFCKSMEKPEKQIEHHFTLELDRIDKSGKPYKDNCYVIGLDPRLRLLFAVQESDKWMIVSETELKKFHKEHMTMMKIF